MRQDLPELLNHAEEIGLVTGLLTDGIRLAESEYLDSLLLAGLDHILIILQPDQEKTWESLTSFTYWAEALDADLFIAAHLTITSENAAQTQDLLKRLSETEISAVSLSVNDASLTDHLQAARDYAAELDLNLVWDLPVPYSALNPVALETEIDHPVEGAGRAWLYIEPDGDVLPTQGVNQVLGNFLHDPWKKIWKKD
jgi:MoaA/NifB/PqqE/SkfB family radical SAM enzyme